MKKYFLVLIILLIGVLSACKENETNFDETDTFSTLNSTQSFQNEYLSYNKLNSTTDFRFLNTFTNTLSEKLFIENDNYVFSPISLYMALGMLINGSSGTTQEELQKLLNSGNEMTKEELNENLQIIYRHNQYKNDGGTAKIANSLWIKKGFEVYDDFINALTTYYNANLYSTLFDETGKNNIAKWINDNTDNMLDMTADKIQVTDYTSLMLINTIYFNNKWKTEFKTKNNYYDIFYGSEESNVEYMKHTINDSEYYDDENIEAVSDYFENGNKIIYFIPKNITINEIFTKDYISLAMNNFESCKAKISVPKFETKKSYELNQVLIDLGVSKMFNENSADFSNLSQIPTYVSKVKQDVAIKLSEEGVKAAAATIITNDTESVEEIINIILNKPFVYVIYDEMNVPLFIGTIQNL